MTEAKDLKVKMRSQVREILARTRKPAGNSNYNNIWIYRDMNLKEMEKEKELRNEAKEKTRGQIPRGRNFALDY